MKQERRPTSPRDTSPLTPRSSTTRFSTRSWGTTTSLREAGSRSSTPSTSPRTARTDRRSTTPSITRTSISSRSTETTTSTPTCTTGSKRTWPRPRSDGTSCISISPCTRSRARTRATSIFVSTSSPSSCITTSIWCSRGTTTTTAVPIRFGTGRPWIPPRGRATTIQAVSSTSWRVEGGACFTRSPGTIRSSAPRSASFTRWRWTLPETRCTCRRSFRTGPCSIASPS